MAVLESFYVHREDVKKNSESDELIINNNFNGRAIENITLRKGETRLDFFDNYNGGDIDIVWENGKSDNYLAIFYKNELVWPDGTYPIDAIFA